MPSARRRLLAHLRSTFYEIERISAIYSNAIEKLKSYTLPNLTTQSAVKWFKLYLRVVDMGVQIRRGEVRHRTLQQFTYSCLHKTGRKGAVHSGLSIDDGNAILQQIEKQRLGKESQLDEWFRKMDILDRDVVGLVDKSVTRCLEDFQRQHSVFYDRVEVTGEDPYQKMQLLKVSGGVASILARVTRTCFGPENCLCEVDAAPWEHFCLESGKVHARKNLLIGAADNTEAAKQDVGIMDIKRKMGYEQLSREEKVQNLVAFAHDEPQLARHTFSRGQYAMSAVVGGQNVPISARTIYQKLCGDSGITFKQHISALLIVEKDSHHLNLSSIGFHSADDLKILVDIFSTPGLPTVKELNASCGFFNAGAFQMMCNLLQVQLLRQNIERLNLCGIAVPTRADFATLLRILKSEPCSTLRPLPAFINLKVLDISFNTLWYEGANELRPLLCSLECLEELSLESCFPELVSSFESSIASSYREATKKNVYCTLLEVSTRLKKLNFGSNVVESRWLDGLFTPGNTLQIINLKSMSRPTIENGRAAEYMEVETNSVWDLHHIKTMIWSSTCDVHSKKMLGILSDGMRGGFTQMLHLDVTVSSERKVGNQMDNEVADAITGIADYAVLKVCRLNYNACNAISHSLTMSIANLVKSGLHECENFSLRVPQLYLTGHTIRELLSSAYLPRTERMILAIGFIKGNGQVQPDCKSCFLHMRKMRELIVECHVAIDEQSDAHGSVRAYLIGFARDLELSWLSCKVDVTRGDQSSLGHGNGKLNRSFVLSEHQNPTKRIWQFHFSANPTFVK